MKASENLPQKYRSTKLSSASAHSTPGEYIWNNQMVYSTWFKRNFIIQLFYSYIYTYIYIQLIQVTGESSIA